MEVYILSLYYNNNDRMYECYKKLILWLNENYNNKNIYHFIKIVI
jgi:hypothetical protein